MLQELAGCIHDANVACWDVEGGPRGGGGGGACEAGSAGGDVDECVRAPTCHALLVSVHPKDRILTVWPKPSRMYHKCAS